MSNRVSKFPILNKNKDIYYKKCLKANILIKKTSNFNNFNNYNLLNKMNSPLIVKNKILLEILINNH